MNKIKITFIIGLLLLGIQGEARCFNISPNRIEINVAPSKIYRDTMTVSNKENHDLNISLRVDDWFKTSDNLKWLKVRPLKFRLKKGEEKQINYKIKVPKNAKGELSAMIFVEAKPRKPGKGMVTINTSIGVPIYAMIEGTERFEAEVEALEVVSPLPLELAVTIKNSGNVHIRPEGTIDIRNKEGKLLTLPLNKYNYPILPGSSRTLEIKTKSGLKQGEYIADIEMAYAGKKYRKKLTLITK
ncbi:MAG: hypothetical protein HQ547_04985 [Candidatus Omnitrophica bacterium]|nr:hypothetical protein [Candidatus Omnitrophota bacterium]